RDDERVNIGAASIGLGNTKVPFAVALENRKQIASFYACLRIVGGRIENRRANDIQMAISVHIDNLNSWIEVAYHCRRVGAQREIPIASSLCHRKQTKVAEPHGIETTILIHVSQADHQGNIRTIVTVSEVVDQ